MDISLLPDFINFIYIVLFFIVIFIAKLLYNLSTPYNNFDEINERQNTSLAFSASGFLIATTFIYNASLLGPSEGFYADVANVSLYTIFGMFLLFLSRLVNDKILLHSFSNLEQLCVRQNNAVALTQAACYIASGLIIAGAISGEGNCWSAIVFYLLGQLILIVTTKIYDKLTHFDLLNELEGQNMATAISFSCTLIAISIILLHALMGPFVSWPMSLMQFSQDAVIALILLPVARTLFDKVLFPSVRIDDAIGKQKNSALALLEGAITISIAVTIMFIL